MLMSPARHSDPYFNQVVSFFHFNGTNGAATFTDATGKAWTTVGTPTLSTTQSKFGSAVGSFPGTSSLSIVNSAFAFGTSELTVEAWIYPTALTQTFHIIFDTRNTSVAAGVLFWINNTGQLLGWAETSANASTVAGTIVANTWYHVAMVVKSGKLTVYVNGVAGSTTATRNANSLTSGRAFIAQTQEGGNNYIGYIDELRVTKAARYAANFAPPTQPFPLQGGSATYDPSAVDPYFTSNVVLLLRGDGANAGTTFTDSSVKAKTFTVTGSAQTSTTQVKFGSSSIYLNGSGSYLQTTSAVSDFVLAGDFTIEFWAWKPANGTNGFDIVCSTYTGTSGVTGWWMELSSSRGFMMAGPAPSGTQTTIYVQYNSSPNDSAWHHWACTRSGTTFYLFKDGVQVATQLQTSSSIPAPNFWVGRDGFNECFNGYIDELRITNGVARYRGNFTLPTAPFPSSS